MLTLAEEIILLALDEKSGELRSTKEFGVECALVGAASLNLVLAKKIEIEVGTEQSLISRGILKEKKSRFAWLPDSERHEIVDLQPYEQTKARIARAILTDDMPDARALC